MSNFPPSRAYFFKEPPIIDDVHMDDFQPLPSHMVTSGPDSVINGAEMDVDGFPTQIAPVFRGTYLTYPDPSARNVFLDLENAVKDIDRKRIEYACLDSQGKPIMISNGISSIPLHVAMLAALVFPIRKTNDYRDYLVHIKGGKDLTATLARQAAVDFNLFTDINIRQERWSFTRATSTAPLSLHLQLEKTLSPGCKKRDLHDILLALEGALTRQQQKDLRDGMANGHFFINVLKEINPFLADVLVAQFGSSVGASEVKKFDVQKTQGSLRPADVHSSSSRVALVSPGAGNKPQSNASPSNLRKTVSSPAKTPSNTFTRALIEQAKTSGMGNGANVHTAFDLARMVKASQKTNENSDEQHLPRISVNIRDAQSPVQTKQRVAASISASSQTHMSSNTSTSYQPISHVSMENQKFYQQKEQDGGKPTGRKRKPSMTSLLNDTVAARHELTRRLKAFEEFARDARARMNA